VPISPAPLPHGGQPVGHAGESTTQLEHMWAGARPVVTDVEHHASRPLLEGDRHRCRGPGVFDAVLQTLQAAEVDGDFNVRRMAVDTAGSDYRSMGERAARLRTAVSMPCSASSAG
jgi:purine nucleoside permease